MSYKWNLKIARFIADYDFFLARWWFDETIKTFSSFIQKTKNERRFSNLCFLEIKSSSPQSFLQANRCKSLERKHEIILFTLFPTTAEPTTRLKLSGWKKIFILRQSIWEVVVCFSSMNTHFICLLNSLNFVDRLKLFPFACFRISFTTFNFWMLTVLNRWIKFTKNNYKNEMKRIKFKSTNWIFSFFYKRLKRKQ